MAPATAVQPDRKRRLSASGKALVTGLAGGNGSQDKRPKRRSNRALVAAPTVQDVSPYARKLGPSDLPTVNPRVQQTLDAIEQALGERASPQRLLVLSLVGRWLADIDVMERFELVHGMTSVQASNVLTITRARWDCQARVQRALEAIGLDVEQISGNAPAGYWTELASRHRPLKPKATGDSAVDVQDASTRDGTRADSDSTHDSDSDTDDSAGE